MVWCTEHLKPAPPWLIRHWALGLIVAEIVVGKFVHMYGRFMRSGLYPASKDRKLIEELVGEVARKNDDDLTAVVKGLLRTMPSNG